MAAPTIFDSTATNPGGTGTSITPALPTHAAGDGIIIWIPNTGNVLWGTNPTGWNRVDQRAVGTASTGIVGTWLWRKVLAGDTLPLTNPLCNLGATATRHAHAMTVRGADLEGMFTLPEYGARGFATGTSNPVRPPSVTTLAPEMLVIIGYGSRTATNAPEQTGYTQDEELITSGTLVSNLSHRTTTPANLTALTNQDASPTSGVRWVAGILCIPSPDYVYYRSGSQALTASGTSATPALPTGTSASDWRGNKELIIATVEAAGTPTISAQVPADWTDLGIWSGTTPGSGTTIKKFWALYDGSISLQFNRSTTGEIAVCLTTYRNPHQTSPIGNANARGNASSTTSGWDEQGRAATKSTVTASCIADGTPSYTAPSGWTERMDGNGIVCADQVFDAAGSTPSASFTLSTASPTACGLIEVKSVSGAASLQTFERSVSVTGTASIATAATFFSILERAVAVESTASVAVSGARVVERSVSVAATANITTSGEAFTLIERSVTVSTTAAIETSGESFGVVEAAVSMETTVTITTIAQRDLLRSVEVASTTSVVTSGVRVVERAVSVSAITDIATVAESFSVFESAVAISASVDIVVSGQRDLLRSVAVDATATMSVSGEVSGVVERSVSVEAITGIAVGGESFSIVESQVEVASTATITVGSERSVSRVVDVSAVADIVTSGEVESGVVIHERAVSVESTADITTTAISFHVLERSSVVSATATIDTVSQRDLQRTSSVATTVTIAVHGQIGTEDVYSRSVSVSAVVDIRAGRAHVLASVERVFVVESGQREFIVEPANRTYVADDTERRVVV